MFNEVKRDGKGIAAVVGSARSRRERGRKEAMISVSFNVGGATKK